MNHNNFSGKLDNVARREALNFFDTLPIEKGQQID